MSLYNVNVEKSKRSLEVRNEVIEMIKDKFDITNEKDMDKIQNFFSNYFYIMFRIHLS